MSEEGFIRDLPQINYLRLRASIGQTGNFLIPQLRCHRLIGC